MGEGRAPTEVATGLGGDIDAALAEIHVPAWILDREGVVRWENGRALELVGDIQGLRFEAVIAPEAHATTRDEFTKKMLGSAVASNYEAVFVNKAGERVPVEVHTVALTNGRRVVGVFGVAAVEPARPVTPQDEGALTPRQLEVLNHLARGRSTSQMAQLLGVSRETVRNHIGAILRAFRVHSRLGAVVEGRRRGLVD